MILTIAFEDSNFNDCRNYYKLKYKKHISYNVKDEALNVIERLRLISFDIIEYIRNYIDLNNIDLVNLDYHMYNIKKIYLRQFKDKSYVFEVKKDRFLKIVDDLFAEYCDEVRNAIIMDDVELESVSLKLRNIFKMYNKSVSRCLTAFEKFSFENNEKLINQLIGIGIHKKDAILVDDCYNKSKDINEKFVFVTLDKEIIESSKSAFELLDSQVHFSEPMQFLNN